MDNNTHKRDDIGVPLKRLVLPAWRCIVWTIAFPVFMVIVLASRIECDWRGILRDVSKYMSAPFERGFWAEWLWKNDKLTDEPASVTKQPKGN